MGKKIRNVIMVFALVIAFTSCGTLHSAKGDVADIAEQLTPVVTVTEDEMISDTADEVISFEGEKDIEEILAGEDTIEAPEPVITVPVFYDDIQLYVGESRFFDIVNVGKVSKVNFTNSDEDVIKINKKTGKITALKAGEAEVEIEMTFGGFTKKVVCSVTVKYSSLLSSPSFSEGYTIDKNNKSESIYTVHKNLKTGEQLELKIDELSPNAKLKFESSNKELVKVGKKGVLTVLGEKGSAVVKITVKDNGTTYSYRLKTHIKNGDDGFKVDKNMVNSYFSDSAFLGNSIGVGQQNYFKSMGDGFLGNPTMLVRGCYSFNNDSKHNDEYMLHYNGKAEYAKDAVKLCGAKYIFINMGTNDMFKSANEVYKDYVAYIKGIKEVNPDVVIYIEATPPMHAGSERTYLNNNAIDTLNSLMEEYCSKKKDMYFIDINTVLKGNGDTLVSEYCSDGYVHVSYKGYEVWTEKVVEYVTELLTKQLIAEDAVSNAENTKLEADILSADELVKALEKSTVRFELKNRLDSINK